MPTIAHTEVCEDRDFAEWHQGRPWCGVWVVRAEAPQVQALVQVARSALRSWLLPRYARQPHITLAYRGLMPRDAADTQAEFGLPQLLADVQALQSSVPGGPLHAAQADALWLARYRSSDIAGPLYFEGRFDLATQQYVAEPEALLQP